MPGVTWYRLAATDVLGHLESDPERGLSGAEARRRLEERGPNAIAEGPRRRLLAIIVGQFADFMILVLLAAALVSGVVGEPQDTIAILVIVVLNAVIGAVQEYRAERAMAALRRLAAPEARVVRDGAETTVAARSLVPGDLVRLAAGDVVPADLRLLEAAELQVDEAVLTGESQAAGKGTEVPPGGELPIGERSDMAWKGTQVTRGRGLGVVVATGMETELGRIAGLLRTEEAVQTPLQRRLARFGRHLAIAVLAVCAVIFATGLLQGQPLVRMFLTAVSLAVAAIPEALPAIVTISLALGARKMVRRHALVRRLPAVETLGSVTYICADKTGTLTENRMALERIVLAGGHHDALPPDPEETPWRRLAEALALSNDVRVAEDGSGPTGDPTEVALVQAAAAAGFDKARLEAALPRMAELPFDNDRNRMTTFHRAGEGAVAFTKGAPEAVLPRCTGTAAGEWDPDARLAEAAALAAEGYRVLAVAYREWPEAPVAPTADAAERDLTLLALVGLIDPPRPEVAAAVADCAGAGITPVMITGDHPGTAGAIAARLGIAGGAGEVLSGEELDALTDAELAARAKRLRVYARVSPEQKIRIVKALQANGEFVAMTGDGVNDAPALKRAGIGVAMGDKGTEVAREAADMVLLDDNFATIVSAVREGRRIFDNIRKFIKDTMSSNSGEIWTLFLAPFLGLPVPLLPIHILWINLVTDGLPGLAFTAEPAEPGIMRRPPRPPGESIFAHGMWQHIVWVGLFVGGISIASQAWAYSRGVAYWQTVVFTVLTVSQLFHSMSVRAERASLFRIGLLSNPAMLGAVLLTVLLQLAVIYVPAFNAVFHTRPLPLFDLLVCFALSSLVLVAVEVEKMLVRRGRLYGEPPDREATRQAGEAGP